MQWCVWNASFILEVSTYFQQQIRTCLPSLFIPITASKDLALLKWLPVCCAVCVLMQLSVSAMTEGYQLLPHTWQYRLEVQRQGVFLQRLASPHGNGFEHDRELNLHGNSSHLSVDFVILLSALFILLTSFTDEPLSSCIFLFVLPSRNYSG